MTKLSDTELAEYAADIEGRELPGNEYGPFTVGQLRGLLNHITAQADEIKALQVELSAIKGRLTEEWLTAKLMEEFIADEDPSGYFRNTAKAIRAHVLGEQT
jgi:hypothetical protein